MNSFPKKRKTIIIASFLLLVAFIQIFFVSSSQSPVLDEQFYPGVGKYTVTTGDFSPFAYRFHPPLGYYINSILLYADNKPVWNDRPFDMTNIIGVYGIDYYLFLTRLPIAIMSLILGIFIFVWARKLYGDKAAIFSLILFCFEPTIIAHSAVATTDMTAATFVFIAMYFFWRFYERRTNYNGVVAGIFLGLALLTKFTALLLLPIVLFLFLYKFRPIRKNIKLIVLYFALAFVVVWGFYGFQVDTINNTVHSIDKSQDFINKTFGDAEKTVINSVINTPLPAASYFTAFGYNIYHSYEGHGAYLFGQYSEHGWLYYYILAFAIKATIPLIIFIFIFLAFMLARKMKFDLSKEIFVLVPIIIFFVVLSALKLNIGLRHLLPVYPFLFVILGKLFQVKFKKAKRRIFNAIVILLVVWSIAEAMLILPYNMSYFNEFVGPRNGYLYLSDPDVDWGQWLKYLSTYTNDKNITEFYTTPPLPEVFTNQYIHNYQKAGCIPKNGIYAMSVSSVILYNRECYRWLRNYSYYDMIGYSVLIYNVTNVQ
ncbi:glycosyltransferase family 39 protein [archaeon]|nr:glycosyltransferase family 39 protein [archaeon]